MGSKWFFGAPEIGVLPAVEDESQSFSVVVCFLNIFGIFTPKIGEDEPNFDDHIFQMGWFNHQLVLVN